MAPAKGTARTHRGSPLPPPRSYGPDPALRTALGFGFIPLRDADREGGRRRSAAGPRSREGPAERKGEEGMGSEK
ncbi:hypothetical protein NL676_021735 [Syzygium grande]|nr:hypothetical protein NL676_021735 [Syzygium grande]